MALLGTLLGVSPNCKAAEFALYPGTSEGNQDVLVNVYLVQGDLETQIYSNEGNETPGTYFTTSIYKFTIENLVDDTNTLYNTGENEELDALIESITSLNGLFKFEFINVDDPDVITYTLGTCAIDCCMANLLGTVINCNCEGGDCHDVIRKIEKILILIRCAVVDAANRDIAAAQEKYNKAAELCDSTCDCNC